jgi:multiple sugar transport system ATP-binding protein
MAQLVLHQVRKSFGAAEVIRGLDLSVQDGEFCVFVGPSGCGKSTLLRLIAGLEECSGGRIDIDGSDVTQVPPARRGIAMVFQSYALYPHMSVADNMGFGLKMAGVAAERIAASVKQAATILQIEHLLERRPKDLSGGQRQRVAIGRAIVRSPKLFLLDEPLSNLDAALRVDMRIELAQLRTQLGATFIYVTHDQVEAMTLADKIVVLRDGRIEQCGAPLELYQRPVNQFVAGFIGSPKMNFLPATLRPGPSGVLQLRTAEGGQWALAERAGLVPDEALVLGIRPEHVQLCAPDGAPVQGRVRMSEHLGSETLVHVQLGAQRLQVKVEGQAACALGEPVGLQFKASCLHLFDAQGRRIDMEVL